MGITGKGYRMKSREERGRNREGRFALTVCRLGNNLPFDSYNLVGNNSIKHLAEL